MRGSRRASSRSCSSIGAATRRSRSAAPAVTRSDASIVMPAWSNTVSRSVWFAISAARPSRCRALAHRARPKDRLAPVGPGVERLAEEVTSLFPDARVAVLSSDLFGSARALKEEIVKIEEGGADIIIGTQLVAKGHNFPHLTLVGVIDADLGLQGSDLRAAETDVSTDAPGRRTRWPGGKARRCIVADISARSPGDPTPSCTAMKKSFWRAEAAERERAGVPPYGRMAGIVLSSPNVKEVFDLGGEMARNDAPLRRIGAEVYGPAPAPIARIRGRHRVRLLVKAAKGAPIQAATAAWIAQFKWPANLRVTIDIDPQSFY